MEKQITKIKKKQNTHTRKEAYIKHIPSTIMLIYKISV